MKIIINDQKREVSARETLADLLRSLKLANLQGVAVAVNEQVVPASQWEGLELKENDSVLLITATQGG